MTKRVHLLHVFRVTTGMQTSLVECHVDGCDDRVAWQMPKDVAADIWKASLDGSQGVEVTFDVYSR